MDALTICLDFHQTMPSRISPLFETMSEEQMRCRPNEVTNSVAWLIWHMARVEDAGVNRLVVERPQVLDEGAWNSRMNVSIRHHGTAMSNQEVTELSNQINLTALRGYYDAVRARTVEVVKALRPEQLDQVNDVDYLRRVLLDEGVLNPGKSWGNPLPYQGRTRGYLLFHFGVTHNYGHIYELFTIRSLMGLPSWP